MLFERCHTTNRKISIKQHIKYLRSKVQLDHPVDDVIVSMFHPQVADIEGIPEFELMAVFPELFEPTPPQQRAGRTLDFEAKLFMAKVIKGIRSRVLSPLLRNDLHPFRGVMNPAIDPDPESDLKLFGDSGLGSSRKRNCNTYWAGRPLDPKVL